MGVEADVRKLQHLEHWAAVIGNQAMFENGLRLELWNLYAGDVRLYLLAQNRTT